MNVSGRLCCLVGETRFDGERLARHPVGCFAVQNPLPGTDKLIFPDQGKLAFSFRQLLQSSAQTHLP